MANEITRLLSTGLQWSEAARFAWIAGLIEGDGCITKQRRWPVVELGTTDPEVARRFADIVGAPMWGPYPRPGRWNPLWRARVTGRERLIDLYIRLEPFLGVRRRGRFQEVLLGVDEGQRMNSWQPQGWEWNAWAAGLFEAEGCISATARSPRLILECGDEDAVARFATIFGGPVLGPYQRGLTKAGMPRRPTYRWQVGGLARCVAVATRLRPWLSERRRSRLRELVDDRRDMEDADQASFVERALWD